MKIVKRGKVQKYAPVVGPIHVVRTYQMVRAATLQNVMGAEYPKDRLFNALAPVRKATPRRSPRKA